MGLDVLTRLFRHSGIFCRPAGAQLAGLRLLSMGANRIAAPRRQDLHRPDPDIHRLAWIHHGEALVREPGPPRLAGVGDVLVLPAHVAHRYASTDARGWRAVSVGFACPGLAELGLRPGVLRPSPLAVRAFTELVGLAADPTTPGPRLAAGLAVLLAELARSAPPRPVSLLADAVATRIRADPLHPPDLPALAREQGLSWSALRQELRRRTGLSPQRLLREARLDLAARALADGASVGAAARAGGFADPFHFSRLFRRAYGLPPRDWRALGG